MSKTKKNIATTRKTNTHTHTHTNKQILLPLSKLSSKLSSKHINELALITQDINIMKHIGQGKLWSIKNIKQFVKDEMLEQNKSIKERKYYSFVLLHNNSVIGFIAGRKNNTLLPVNSSDYDLLLRMFISNKYKNQGFGKLILKLFIKKYTHIIHNIKNINNINLISDIDKNNISSIKIHLVNGFTYTKTIIYPNKKNYDRYILNITS